MRRCVVQVLWRLSRSGTRLADDAFIVAQLQARGKALAAVLVDLLENPELGEISLPACVIKCVNFVAWKSSGLSNIPHTSRSG